MTKKLVLTLALAAQFAFSMALPDDSAAPACFPCDATSHAVAAAPACFPCDASVAPVSAAPACFPCDASI